MADPPEDTPREATPIDAALEELAPEPSPDRRMLLLFLIVIGVSMCGMLWLAMRSSTPPAVRDAMDFVLQAGMGALLAYAGFRSLALFPFRFFDLLAIVAVLALFMKVAVETIDGIVSTGFFEFSQDSSRLGITIQMCCMAASVLLAGAALGLRHCLLLKFEHPALRMLTVLSGMLIIPGGAGCAVFPVLILRDALSPEGTSPDVGSFLLLWLVSLVATIVNSVCLIRTMALTHAIEAREKMP